MLSHDAIERRLRLPAPDEPRVLPALLLPSPSMSAEGSIRTRWRAGRPAAPAWPRLAFAVGLLLVALAAALVTGALRLDRVLDLLNPNAPFHDRGVTLQLPDGWTRLASGGGDTGSSVALLATSAAVSGCTAQDVDTGPPPTPVMSGDVVIGPDQTGQITSVEDRIYACVAEQPMAEGEMRVTLAFMIPQAIGIGPIGDFDTDELFNNEVTSGGWYFPTEADGWTEVVDGMPARLVVASTSSTPGAEEVRTWVVMAPGGGLGPWYVQVALAGPDLAAQRAQADEIARSLRFESGVPALDPATRDQVLAEAIDRADREARRYPGTEIFSCFPREPGERTVTVDEGPHGVLWEPAEVTCTTTIEETNLRVWRATLVVSWEAQGGLPAGSWGQELIFDGALGNDNSVGGSGQLGPNDGTTFPGTAGAPAPPLAGPMNIPTGSMIRVVPPGISQTRSPIPEFWESQEPFPGGENLLIDVTPGQRYLVVDGPLTHLGVEWYRVHDAAGMYPGAWMWLPGTDGERPLIEIVEPRCPATMPERWTVAALLDLLPGERVACLGSDEITIDPAIVQLGDEFFEPGDVEGSPGWLADYSMWRAFGAGGPDGIEPALAFAIHPDLGDSVPTGTWLTLTGHFDDPAAATCDREFPEGGGWIREVELIRIECSQLFVVTGTEARSAP